VGRGQNSTESHSGVLLGPQGETASARIERLPGGESISAIAIPMAAGGRPGSVLGFPPVQIRPYVDMPLGPVQN
jgi:hypothetical protein